MYLFKNQFNNFLFSYLPMDYITNMMSSLLWQYSNMRVYLEDNYKHYYDNNKYFTKLVDSIVFAKKYASKQFFNVVSLPEEDSWNNFITLIEDNDKYNFELLDKVVHNEKEYMDNIQNTKEFLDNVNDHNLICLLSKYNDSFYVRNSFNNQLEHFDKSDVDILSVTYSHPEMESKIDMHISKDMLYCNNELFNAAFIYHCLKYKNNESFVFNKDYSVEIMDSNCDILTIKYGQYLHIEKNGLKIEKFF
jgi:hypothetical protein